MTSVEDPTPLGFDPFQPSFQADPYAAYRELRASDPVRRSPIGLWTLTRHADCVTALRDHRLGHTAYDETDTSRQVSFLTLNPPDHTRLRGLVSKAFTPKVVRELQPRVQQLVDDLIAGMRGHGEVDLIKAFAHPLPVMVISEMIGVPAADQSRFGEWSEAMARGLDPDFVQTPEHLARRAAAKAEFDNYFRELIELRRADPAEDLLTGLVAVEQDGDRLGEQELLDILALLLIAGHETTVNLIANGTLALLRDPDQLRWLREHPERAPEAVEELLRYDPPVQFTMREALADTEIAGHTIRAGEIVAAVIGAANRDPEAFEDPDRLDLTRAGGKQVSFGQGIHFCIGAPLARLEGQVALVSLATALPELELVDHTPPYRENLVLRGLASLTVRA